ncbi:MAG: ABC transporter ATP-binding protein [Solirubrobacterales bacterium]
MSCGILQTIAAEVEAGVTVALTVRTRSKAASTSHALETIGVSKRYRRSGPWALLDVDLVVRQGTITALVGPNGAGKSTLIRSWIGFERPTRGRVLVGGIDPQTDRAGAVAKLGYLSQSTSLYRGLTVAEHLDLARTLRATFDKQEARQRLEELAIPLSQVAGSLSGGQAAQVALCIALGTRAPVLLLDEPLASLDPLARHDFLNVLLSAVRERGATALLSSHIVSDIAAVCDQLVVLGRGRVTLQSPIGQAIAGHRLVPERWAAAEQTVATFTRPGGEPTALIRSSDPSLPAPSLEELVMGYLSASRAGVISSDGRAA